MTADPRSEGYLHFADRFSKEHCGSKIAITGDECTVKMLVDKKWQAVRCVREYKKEKGVSKVCIGYKVGGTGNLDTMVGISKKEVMLNYEGSSYDIKGTYWK